ncbi:MAG TPA: hypothetical protein VF728_09610 [Nocardioides sp.]
MTSDYITNGGSVGEICLPATTHPQLSVDPAGDSSSSRSVGLAVYRLADR